MVSCPICNKKFKQLTNSHLKMHDLSIDEFKFQYPTLPLLCEEIKNQKQAAANKRASNGYASISKYMKERREKEFHESFLKYGLNPNFCINCENPLPLKERKNKFCNSETCVYMSHSRDHTEESRKKLSSTMKEKIRTDPVFKKQILENLISPKETLKLREAWKYEEIKRILDSNKIIYEFEFGIGDLIYDLALFETKTLIEFDGTGHGYECVKEYEDNKDQLAINNGWKIFRVEVQSNAIIDSSILFNLNLIK